jgi:Kef-type K+ transport system membrane component KefB
MSDIARLLVQVFVILAAARILGALFRRIHQPQVMGEMVAGILLGPSLLGWAAPRFFAALFPASSLGYLNALSQIGLVIFLFLVGLEINPGELKKQGHAAVLTSHVSITAPFVLAGPLAFYLYPRLSDNSVSFAGFALFLGAAMSITAFPVLARILSDRDMLRGRLGTVAISCAAVDDVTGWCVLAYIMVLVRASQGAASVWLTAAGLLAFILAMVHGAGRLCRRFETVFRARQILSDSMLALMVLFAIASAWITDWLGVHMLFGAFLAGAVMPKSDDFVRSVSGKLQFVPVAVLLPLFFALTGLGTSIGLIRGSAMWFYCGLIIATAIAGKLGGSMIAARLTGMPLRQAAGLGILMNTRGLMELIILAIGRDIGVISPALFSMMVLMALITTFMTTPLLEWVCPKRLIVHQSAAVVLEPEVTPMTTAAS